MDMRWKQVAWAGCLAPFVGGCLTAYKPSHHHLAEHSVSKAERAVSRAIQNKARSAWQTVRSEFPRKMFSAEFRDGFLDGYSDYLDRGGDSSPPAVPPVRYTQNSKYYTPEGHALMRDYLLGFKYGSDVAVATGQRHYLTVPVLIPEGTGYAIEETASVAVPPTIDVPVKPMPPAQPLPAPRPLSKLPMPRPLPGKEAPPRAVSSPANDPEVSKFGTGPSSPLNGFVPQVPPLKSEDPLVPPLPGLPGIPTIPPAPMSAKPPVSEVVPASAVSLPAPPREILDLPDDLPTPPVLNDLPDLPPLPVNHPEPVKK
jgi:hypothetical protein